MNKKIRILIFAVILITQIYLISSLTINSVITSTEQVQPGEKFSLDLKIENNLEDDVKNVIVSLILNDKDNPIPFAPYQSSNEVRIEEIESDDDEKVSFDLIAFPNAISGTYNIPVQVRYILNSETKNESLGLVSVTINAKPKIDISSEGVLIGGQSGKLTIKVVNSGLGDAKFLSINLDSVSGIRITNSNRVYIGNIDSNDFDNAEFNVFVSENAPSLISLPVELSYTDSANNQIKENKIITIKTYTQKEAISLGLIKKNNTIMIIIFIVGFLILFFIYRRIRKRSRNKKIHNNK